MNSRNLILIGLILWILVGILCLLIHAKKIENKLTVRAQEQLKLANMEGSIVSFSGRDALLTGKTGSVEMIKKAEDLIRAITGVRIVDNRLILDELAIEMPETTAISESKENTESLRKEELKIDLSHLKINFESNSYQLSNKAKPTLNQLQKILREHSHIQIKIFGHTDNKGTDEYNKKLSIKRAEAVKLYFVKNGIPPERFSIVGKGETEPIEDNSTPEGRYKNRRVEFIIVKED